MNNTDVAFQHNFCESKLNDNQPPEIWNSISALFMVMIPFIFGFPINEILLNLATTIQLNGIASCYYHYNLTWFGKQIDEISMILANYFGLWYLLKVYFVKNKYSIDFYNRLNTIFMSVFISINTINYMDSVFPFLFLIYVLWPVYLIYLISIKYKMSYKRYMVVSLVGAVYWVVSEVWCNEWTSFGHCAWHILFPTGFYKLVLQYDRKIKIE